MKKIVFLSMLIAILTFGVSYAEVIDADKTIKVDKYITDSLDTADEVDYFYFKLSKKGSVQIEFEFDINGKYFMEVSDADDNYKLIQRNEYYVDYNTTTGNELLVANKLRLAAGEYRIKVWTTSNPFSDENYKFRVNYETESKDGYEIENNNDAKNAMEIDTDDIITGNLQSTDDVDFYMIELPQSGQIQLNLEYFYQGAYNVILYGTSGTRLQEIQYNEAITQTKPYDGSYFNQVFNKIRVPKGTYYIKISNRKFTNEDYNFSVSYMPEKYGNFEEEFNDTIQTATEIYNNTAVFGNLSYDRDVDYYAAYLYEGDAKIEFEIPANSKYNVILYKEINGSQTKDIASKEINEENKIFVIEDVTENCRYYFQISSRTFSNEDYSIKLVNNVVVPVEQRNTKIDLQIGNTYMNVNGIGRLIDNSGTMPVLVEERTMLPIRAVIETLGGNVGWDEATFTTTVSIGDKNIKIKIGDKVAYVNGTAKVLDVSAQLINKRTMLPLRFIMENLGGDVHWNDSEQIVTIMY